MFYSMKNTFYNTIIFQLMEDKMGLMTNSDLADYFKISFTSISQKVKEYNGTLSPLKI